MAAAPVSTTGGRSENPAVSLHGGISERTLRPSLGHDYANPFPYPVSRWELFVTSAVWSNHASYLVFNVDRSADSRHTAKTSPGPRTQVHDSFDTRDKQSTRSPMSADRRFCCCQSAISSGVREPPSLPRLSPVAPRTEERTHGGVASILALRRKRPIQWTSGNSKTCDTYRPNAEGLESRWLLSASSAPAPAATSASSTPTYGVEAIHNVTYTDQAGQAEQLDLYVPVGKASPGGWPAILALPGGGWRWVNRSDLGDTVSEFAKFGYVVAVADYAFASSNPATHIFPLDIDDTRDAIRWLRTTAATKYGVDPNKIATWGESAGGNLASLLGTYPNGPLPDDHSPPTNVSASVQAVVDFYGPADLTKLWDENPRVQPYLQTFLGGSPTQEPARYAAASPTDHVSLGCAALSDFPRDGGSLGTRRSVRGIGDGFDERGRTDHGRDRGRAASRFPAETRTWCRLHVARARLPQQHDARVFAHRAGDFLILRPHKTPRPGVSCDTGPHFDFLGKTLSPAAVRRRPVPNRGGRSS